MRYLTQRDPDGTWSVCERDSNRSAIYMGVAMAGLTEKLAVMNARRLNAWKIVTDAPADPSPWLSGRQFAHYSAA